ncbi:hypothetical protein [Sphingobacterium yanglingense]|uniref:Uncharacterized protein n=1 Tax=Sphingobacterium yanglingense TaxID=1437280 RepID=A0A4V3DE50_9SPHI|nr:hypothetical protein [Sphingobacterium yanglingense]TDQ79759.1 hypothetical protein CLV99_1207 [Sphingobacterium yanglingense]
MKEAIIRIRTLCDGKQIGINITFLKMEHGEDYHEFPFGEYNIEYFEDDQIHLEDAEYPESMFEQVIPMASVVAPADPIPISTYRGLKIKKEFRKYRNQEEEKGGK